MKYDKFFILIILIFFVTFGFILENLSKKIISVKYKNIFDDKSVSIYKKYSKKTNHLRNPLKWKSKELIYSRFGEGRKVLIQGDSWIELLLNKEIKNILNQYATKNNIEFIIGGTSSFSPSLYNAQFNILRDDFLIEPNIVLTLFDQSDIGDELCRYKNFLYEENNKFFVKSYDENSNYKIFNANGILNRIDIINEKSFYLTKLTKIALLKIKENFNKNINKCNFKKDILKYIKNKPDQESLKYFKSIVERYFNNLEKTTSIEKVIIMTHPHRGHITKEYDYNISILLNEVLKKNNYKKILFYNFQQKINLMLKEKNLDELMLADDIASHPTKKHYKELANQIIILIEDLT